MQRLSKWKYTGNQRLVSSVLKDGYDVPNLSSQSLDIGEDYAVKTNTQNYNEVSTNFASNLKSAGSDGVNKIVVTLKRQIKKIEVFKRK